MSAVSRLERGRNGKGMDGAAGCWILRPGRVSIYYHQPHFIRIKQQLKGLEDGGESQACSLIRKEKSLPNRT